jgi:hypothetical protein
MSSLNAPYDDSGTFKVKPSDNSQHLKYTFYIKVTARSGPAGASNKYFGPYELDIGCTPTSVTFTDASSGFVSNVNVYVGDSVVDKYTFAPPTSSRAWCQIVKHEIVDLDGTPWSGSSQVAATQGCTS